MLDCIFCKIIKENNHSILHKEELFVVIKDICPKAPIHLLAIPNEHISNLAALKPEHKELMANLILLLPKIATSHGLNDGFRTIINTGPGGGQVIPHLHFHLLGGGKLPSM